MKNAVITGCNRGLGNGILKVLLEHGYFVYGLNKTPISEDLKNYKEFTCDVSDKLSVIECVKQLPQDIELLVVNAGIRRFGDVEELEYEDWINSVNTNLNGTFYIIKELITTIKKNKGDIVVIGSHAEKYPFGKGSAYCSTKLAIKGLTDCLIDEVRYDDVRLTYLSLGAIKNRDHGIDESWKLTPEEVGMTIYSIISLPKKVLIPYIDVRPLKPLKDNKSSIEKLQYV